MRHGSLFSGIGGFDLAAEWMGWENIFHCEWNKFGQQVLHYYWPKAICYENICTTDFRVHRGTIDILTGGFPCQPYSAAGLRRGKEDERHLWPEMLRAIREIQPRWIVGENVRGLTNWNGGVVFDEVCAEMENIGYQVAPVLIPASGVGAPHRRERIFFVAYCDNNGCNQCNSDNGVNALGDFEQMGKSNIFNSKCIGWDEKSNENGIIKESQQEKCRQEQFGRTNSSQSRWWGFPSVSPVCFGDDGISDRLDSITFPKWRNESIKAGGNAVVPQVVMQIFKTIELYERTKNSDSNKKTP